MALSDDLTCYYKLDEASGNALDAHGGIDLTDNASVGTGTGIINGGRDFERDSFQYFSRVDHASLSLGADQAFTWTCWVKFETIPTSMGIICKDDTSNREYDIYYAAGPDRFQFLLWDGSANLSSLNADNLGSPSTGVWYFIATWHDPVANEVGIQVNNGTANTASWTTGTRDQAAPFELGRLVTATGTEWDGIIDEVGFWKRALTSGERTDLYNGGAGRDYTYITTPAGGSGGLVFRSPVIRGASLIAA